ncbi:MAG: hypothetical protein RIB67_00650 [Miltoncostaeaceae bacterium]
MSDPAEELLADLQRAYHAAAARADREPVGVRAVEWAPSERGYLCAFEDGRFLCLDTDLAPAASAARAREIAGTGLLWEHLEERVDPERLEGVATAIARLLASAPEHREVAAGLERVAARVIELLEWRVRPERALASLVDLDEGTALHDRLHAAYGNYLRLSEPLVERQDELPGDLVAALRDVEQAAGWAGLLERLADAMARAMTPAAEGADQVVDAHLTPLAP